MGASDSKLVFKQGIFKLSEQKDVPADDRYWAGFWELPESAEDVFSLFSSADIRRIRDDSLGNLETLILAVTSRLCALRVHPEFPSRVDSEAAPSRDALNCIRVLTRLLPFIYEADHLEQWEEKFFWGVRRRRSSRRPKIVRTTKSEVLFDDADFEKMTDVHQGLAEDEDGFEEVKPLAEELIDTLIDLLFYSDFTLPKGPSLDNQVTFAIWQNGVGCNTAVGTSKEYESNRMEILRLLLTLASKSMYTSVSRSYLSRWRVVNQILSKIDVLPVTGIRAITYITTISSKQLVLTLLCSLLNTTLKYNPATWRVPYDHVIFRDPKQMYVTYCLQLLLVLIMYPVPESSNGVPPKNYFRHFLGRLHRPQDFQFLVDGMTRILNQPLQATSSYLPGSQRSLTWAPEIIMLFWEVVQCNKRFRSFIVDTDRAHDFIVLLTFNAVLYKHDSSKQGIVRMCVFVLQTLSVEPTFGTRLNKSFHGQEALPQSVRISNFRGTYADFLIISIYTLITASKGKLTMIYPALLAIMNNIAPHILELSVLASSKLMQLFNTMSSPNFLFANETNHDLLQSLLEAINGIVENQYDKNASFVYALLKNRKKFLALRHMTLENGELTLQRQQRRAELTEEPDLLNGALQRPSNDSLRSPVSPARAPSLPNVAEEDNMFAIGEDDDFEEEGESKARLSHSSLQSTSTSREPSVLEFSSEDAVPLQVRGMSEKARGKLPANQSPFSRHDSNASSNTPTLRNSVSHTPDFEPSIGWIASWVPELPLHTTITLIEQLSPQLPHQTASSTRTSAINAIRRSTLTGISPSPIRIHLFEWSPLSLGWYESLLWSFIFSAEMSMIAPVAIWKNTHIRLFRVQEATAQGPSLLAPRGAVDAVGSNLVQKIGSLSLSALGSNSVQTNQRNSRGGVIRDV